MAGAAPPPVQGGVQGTGQLDPLLAPSQSAGTGGYNGQGSYTNQTTNAGTGTSANQYNASQLALQGQLGNNLSGYLSGQQIPSWMTAPPAAFKAYNDAFQNYVAPGLAAQYGAGSPQIGSQQMLGNEQLAANLYQNGVSNYLGGLGLAGNIAYQPIGQAATNSATQNGQQANDVFAMQQQPGYSQPLVSYLLALAAQKGTQGGLGLP